MMRYESNRKYDGRKKSVDRQSPSQDSLGFDYYIEQLHEISIEQRTTETREAAQGDHDDDDALEIFAQVIRLLWRTGDAFLDTFFAEAEHKTGLEMKKIYPALQRMQTAGLVEINEGKVCLTDSGKDLMRNM